MKNKIIAVAATLCMVISFLPQTVFAYWTSGYEVIVDGESAGIVEDIKVVETAVLEVNSKIISRYGIEEVHIPNIKLRAVMAANDKISDDTQIYNNIAKSSDKVSISTRIVVDGVKTVCVKDRDQMQQVIEMAVDKNAVEGANNGVIELIGSEEEAVFTDEILSVEKAADYLADGGFISVKSEKIQTKDMEYVPQEKQVLNNDLYEGERRVIDPGRNGTKVEKTVTSFINGEYAQENVTYEIKDEGEGATVEIGTKERPKGEATGNFIMPTKGRITSEFGARWGRHHNGLDIAAPVGTPIYASDGGEVICSEYKNSFGYLIKIDHKNGYVTYYAHNSKNLVSVGEKVKKGQLIAHMGATGNSTGSHCHFEIRIDDVPQNPKNFVK